MDSNNDKCFPSSRSLGRTQGTPTYFVQRKRGECVFQYNENSMKIIFNHISYMSLAALRFISTKSQLT